jgi:hypothetical protein
LSVGKFLTKKRAGNASGSSPLFTLLSNFTIAHSRRATMEWTPDIEEAKAPINLSARQRKFDANCVIGRVQKSQSTWK